jgi:hypothetical protein
MAKMFPINGDYTTIEDESVYGSLNAPPAATPQSSTSALVKPDQSYEIFSGTLFVNQARILNLARLLCADASVIRYIDSGKRGVTNPDYIHWGSQEWTRRVLLRQTVWCL